MKREEALTLVKEMLLNQNLVKHCLAVEAIMRALCRELRNRHPELPAEEFDEEEWGLVGLLHDADYEVTNKELQTHTDLIVAKVREMGVSERIINGILAHHELKKPDRENFIEKGIYAVDELSGLITATALISPDKKLSSISVESVMRKFKNKNFAAGALREPILTCESDLGIPLEEFIRIALEAMQGISSELGL